MSFRKKAAHRNQANIKQAEVKDEKKTSTTQETERIAV